jgi:hypothetical protein
MNAWRRTERRDTRKTNQDSEIGLLCHLEVGEVLQINSQKKPGRDVPVFLLLFGKQQ